MRLRAVHENPNLTAEQQHEQIDQIMTSLPEELIEKLPQPPGFENLPQSTREQLRSIHRDKVRLISRILALESTNLQISVAKLASTHREDSSCV